jgi:hypothetical protein
VRKSSMGCAVLLMALTGWAHAQAAAPAFEAFAKGVQIYTCKGSNDAYAWSLKAPEATLADAKGNPIGKHFAGPSWQSTDGSTVVGEPLNASPSPDAGAVAWLVLHAKSHEGKGWMGTVEYIVRTHTKGGVAPAKGCDAAHAGGEVRVPYSAVYLFFRS